MDKTSILALMNIAGTGRKTVFKIINKISIENDDKIDKIYKNDEKYNEAYKKAETIIKKCNELDIQVISYFEDNYPQRLKSIPDPPAILFAKGSVKCLNYKNSIAVVGTRSPTDYGLKASYDYSRMFSEKGFNIVSGLAVGVDTMAHKGCFDGKSKTIAVLPCGLDRVYPSQNKNLAEEIIKSGGCIVSEYPPRMEINKGCFVQRDRIQSGLSLGVLVIETNGKDGTIHTARFCLKQKRILGCIVHPIKYQFHENTQGNRNLIKEKLAFAVSGEEDLDKYIKNLTK